MSKEGLELFELFGTHDYDEDEVEELVERMENFIKNVGPMEERDMNNLGMDSISIGDDWPTFEYATSSMTSEEWYGLRRWFSGVIPTLICEIKRYRTPRSTVIH